MGLTRLVVALSAILAVVFTVGTVPPAAANGSLLQYRALGFLANLPEDYQGISVADLRARLDVGVAPFLLDVREPDEFASGHIRGAVNIPIRTISTQLSRLPTSKGAEIVTICPSGFRSAMVTMALTLGGYTNVRTMTLGMREWNARGYPVVKAQ